MNDFTILEADGGTVALANLAKLVQEYIAQGWQPIGQPQYRPDGQVVFIPMGKFCQIGGAFQQIP